MNLEKILNSVTQLPPAPEVLPQLLTILQDKNVNLDEVVQLIHLDPALTAEILKLANSNGTAIHDLREAAEKLGITEITKLVIAVSSKGIVDKSIASYGLEKGQLWEKSLAAAIIMESLAKRIDVKTENAYLVGILHNIGKLAISQLHKEDYQKIHQSAEDKGVHLSEVEKEILSYNHAEMGATLLRRWNFSEDIWMPIDYQFCPMTIPQERYKKMACALHACNWMIHYIELNKNVSKADNFLDENAADYIQFDKSELHSHIIFTQEKLDEMRSKVALTEQHH